MSDAVVRSEIDALREENALMREHIEASEKANAISRELVIQQFQEVERVLALLEQENGLRKGILDTASQVSIIYCDSSGVIQLFNRGAENLLGYRASDVVGRLPLLRLHYGGEVAAVVGDAAFNDADAIARLAKLAGRMALPVREWTYLADGGREISVNLSFSPVWSPSGSLAGLMCAAMDNTEIKAANAALQRKNEELSTLLAELQRTQQQLLQSEKMASLGQLAAGVAHEINNPIGFVTANIGALARYLEELLALVRVYDEADSLLATDDELFRRIAQARRKADVEFLAEDAPTLFRETREGLDRVRQIVADLRTITQMGEASLAYADLNAGIASTLSIVAGQTGGGVCVETAFAPLPLVECVWPEINQVVLGILTNAMQAMDSAGRLRVETRVGEKDTVEIVISDTGCGIAPEHLPHIFDPFFTTRAVGSGKGLGLSIAYGIVQGHRGSITVQSEVGVGTSFCVSLPQRQPEH